MLWIDFGIGQLLINSTFYGSTRRQWWCYRRYWLYC